MKELILNKVILESFDPSTLVRMDRCYQRPYHSWNHIKRVLSQCLLYGYLQKWFIQCIVAHDALDTDGKCSFDKKYIDFVTDVMGRGATHCERFIKTATDHEVMIGTAIPVMDEDLERAKLLHDADLSILAATKTKYMAYATALKKECCSPTVSEFKYDDERRTYLDRMLSKPKIFVTDRYSDADARRNMSDELKTLE